MNLNLQQSKDDNLGHLLKQQTLATKLANIITIWNMFISILLLIGAGAFIFYLVIPSINSIK